MFLSKKKKKKKTNRNVPEFNELKFAIPKKMNSPPFYFFRQFSYTPCQNLWQISISRWKTHFLCPPLLLVRC